MADALFLGALEGLHGLGVLADFLQLNALDGLRFRHGQAAL